MKKRASITTLGLLSATVLAGCSSEVSIGNKHYELEGYSAETPDTGLYLVPESFLIDCGSWSPYNVAFESEKEYKEVYYCTGVEGYNIFLYKGVVSFNFKTLTTSQYYASKGTNKSDVHLTSDFKENNLKPSYSNGVYSVDLIEDPVARFDENLDEKNAEGVLITQSQLDKENWTDLEDDSDVLVSENNSFLYAGVLFASMLALQNSSYYKSKGSNTSGIAVPNSVKNGKDSLGYSNGKYFSNGNIKSSKATTIPSSNKGSSPIGSVTQKNENNTGSASAAAAGAGSAMKKSTDLTKGNSTSKSSNSTSSTSRGSGGVSSGAKGGGAS